jgi:hypothetical protein
VVFEARFADGPFESVSESWQSQSPGNLFSARARVVASARPRSWKEFGRKSFAQRISGPRVVACSAFARQRTPRVIWAVGENQGRARNHSMMIRTRGSPGPLNNRSLSYGATLCSFQGAFPHACALAATSEDAAHRPQALANFVPHSCNK